MTATLVRIHTRGSWQLFRNYGPFILIRRVSQSRSIISNDNSQLGVFVISAWKEIPSRHSHPPIGCDDETQETRASIPTSETPTPSLFLASFTVLTSPLIKARYEQNGVLKIAYFDRYYPRALGPLSLCLRVGRTQHPVSTKDWLAVIPLSLVLNGM